MGETLDLNLLLPAGMTRRQRHAAARAAALGAGRVPNGSRRAPRDRTLNYFTWSAGARSRSSTDAKKKVNIDLKPTFYTSSDEMMAKLRGGGTKLYDMIVPVQNYVHAGGAGRSASSRWIRRS